MPEIDPPAQGLSPLVEDCLLAALEHVECGIVAVDRAGEVVVFNRAAENITGYLRDEVLGCSCRTLPFASALQDEQLLGGILCGGESAGPEERAPAGLPQRAADPGGIHGAAGQGQPRPGGGGDGDFLRPVAGQRVARGGGPLALLKRPGRDGGQCRPRDPQPAGLDRRLRHPARARPGGRGPAAQPGQEDHRGRGQPGQDRHQPAALHPAAQGGPARGRAGGLCHRGAGLPGGGDRKPGPADRHPAGVPGRAAAGPDRSEPDAAGAAEHFPQRRCMPCAAAGAT